MRRRTIATLGAGAMAGAAGCALLTTGIVTASLGILLAPPLAPHAAAEELVSFDSCEQLREWYVDAALDVVEPWGIGWPGYSTGDMVFGAPAMPRSTDAVAASEQAVGSNGTGTNVQEAGVDEPDVAKTNGDLVVHATQNQVILTDVRHNEPREVTSIDLPRGISNPEVLLVGDTVVVFGGETSFGRGPMPVDGIGMPDLGGRGTTHVLTLDITDPASPTVERHDRIDGGLVSARGYDGTIRAVISTGVPRLDFVHPGRNLTHQEALRENRRMVRETTIEDWLPQVRTTLDGKESDAEALVRCSQVLHPRRQSGLGTISILTFDADSPEQRSTTAVTAGGDLVYSSAERLYVATRSYWKSGTEVHAFALDDARTTYVASGKVPGVVRDRWSLSEFDGRLRVATALGRMSWRPRENAVIVLDEDGRELVEVGRAGGMGRGEDIQSVRWFGDLAIVVTFRQIDPLYTVDLSDPTRPRVVGELKIPGFSAYLHPIGDGRLLGLGQDATRRGVTTGAQAAVFDVRDLERPRRVDTEGFRRHTELTTTWDPRAFTYLPDQRTALAPLQSYRSGVTRLAILRIGEDGTLSRRTTTPVADWRSGSVRTLPLDDAKVALVVGDKVTLLAV